MWDYVFDWTILKYQQQGGTSGSQAGAGASRPAAEARPRADGGAAFGGQTGGGGGGAAPGEDSEAIAAMRRLGL